MLRSHNKLICVLAFIIIILTVGIMPRFGLTIVENLPTTKVYKFVKTTQKSTELKESTYTSADNSQLSICYTSRFFGRVEIWLNGEFQYEFTPRIDGSITNTRGEDSPLQFMLYSIISRDSGAFYFIHFIKPLLFFALAFAVYFKKSSNRHVVNLQKITSALLLLIAILFSFRII